MEYILHYYYLETTFVSYVFISIYLSHATSSFLISFTGERSSIIGWVPGPKVPALKTHIPFFLNFSLVRRTDKRSKQTSDITDVYTGPYDPLAIIAK